MATDLSFEITWLQKNADSLDKVAAQLDKVGDRLDKLDHKDANPKVTIDTSDADKKIDELKKKLDDTDGGIKLNTATVIGLAGLAASGAAVAGGLLAIPAAIAAIGIESEKTNPEVVASFSSLAAVGKQTLRDGFAPFVPAMVDFADTTKDSLDKVQGGLFDSAQAAAPLLTIIGDDFVKAAEQGIGGSVPIIQSLRPVAQAVGDDLVKVEQGIVGFLGNLDTKTAAQGLSELGDGIEQILPPLGSLVSDAVPAGNALLSVLGPGIKSVEATAEAAMPVVTAFGAAVSFLGPDISTYTGPALVVVGATKLLTGSWTDLGGVVRTVKPLFTNFTGVVTSLGQKVGYTTAATNAATRSDLEAALVRAQLTKATAEEVAMTTAWAAAEAGTAESELEAVAATDALTVAEKALAKATAATAATTDAASFSLGPLGIGLGALTLLALPFIGSLNAGSDAASKLTGELGNLQQAASDTQSLSRLFQTDPNAQAQLSMLQKYGVTIKDLTAAQDGNVAAQEKIAAAAKQALDAINAKSGADEKALQLATAQNTTTNANGTSTTNYAGAVTKAQAAVDADKTAREQANQTYADAKTQLDSTNAAAAALAATTSQSSVVQQQASSSAGVLGLTLDQATLAYRNLAQGQTYAMSATQQSSDTILGQVLAVGTANSTIENYFKTADQAVSQASQAVSDASHSYKESAGAVADAQHSEAQAAQAVATAQQGVATAQRGVSDAEAGVVTATDNVTKSRQAAKDAQVSLTAAEAAATEQLKELHLQLTSQVTSEESARVALFDQTVTSGALGVTAANAQQIASQKVTATNEDKIKSAIDLLKAEEDLNGTLNTGVNLRDQVAAADKAGVAGSAGVISAQQAIVSAQAQIVSSEAALVKAHEAVDDAQAQVVKAQQAVTDAAYNEKKAHEAVTEAMYNSQKASEAVTQAQQQLKTAQDNASSSLDAHTGAGQRNLAMLKQIAEQLAANEDPQTAGNDLIRDAAGLFKGSAAQAQAYLTKLGLIPANFKFGVTAVAAADFGQLNTSYRTILTRGVRATAGLPVPFASGGFVSGPGGPRDDQIPAMLSNREFVEPADSVSYYGVGMMEAIRNKSFPRFADGGLIDANAILSTLGVDYQTSVHALAVMGGKTSPGLAAYTPPAAGALAAGSGLAGYSASGGVARWSPQILQALGLLGQSSSWLGTVERRMNQESGGNPNIVNKWDSNWARGTPSVGLMQVIGPTFAGNAGPFRNKGPFEYGVSVDPEANIYSGLHYAIGRYGTLAALDRPGGYATGGLVALRPPKLYDSGGWLPPGGTGTSQLGQPEAVLNPEESAAFVQLAKSAASGVRGATPIEIHVHPPQNASVDQIAAEVMRRLQFAGR